MKYYYYIVTFFAFFLPAYLPGQITVKASVSTNKILIGEPIKLVLEAYTPLGHQVAWFPLDTIPHFEFINKGNIDTIENIEGKKFSQTLIITSFDSGRWTIPQLELKVDDKSYLTDTIPVDIGFAEFNPADDYRDIKDIIEVIHPLSKYIPWMITSITFISLILLIYFLRKQKTVIQPPRQNVPKLSAFDEAMHALAAVRKKGLPENGQVKGYYTDLNNILRIFLFRKLNISTSDKTNEELILHLKQMNIPGDAFSSLTHALRISDFVKFAKYQPDVTDNEKNFEIIEASIKTLNSVV